MECIRIWREAKMMKRGNEKCLEVVWFLGLGRGSRRFQNMWLTT
jgi:hypothetical protein